MIRDAVKAIVVSVLVFLGSFLLIVTGIAIEDDADDSLTIFLFIAGEAVMFLSIVATVVL